jgi:two-component system, NarL family, sensor kinase
MRVSNKHRERAQATARSARASDSSFSLMFARFAVTGLVAMVLIGAIGFVLVRRSATTSAISEAKQLTELAGRGIVEPMLSGRVLQGDPHALRRLDATVHRRILRGTPIVRVKVWDAGGRIVYSDVPSLIGRRFALGEDESTVLREGGVHADASDLTRPENLSERRFKRLVEVYVAIRAPDGTPLLYEDYERSSSISASSRRQLESLLPALGGALLVLYLIQLPLAYWLVRRLRRRQREREELLRSAIDASDLERRRIAADLHDSAVQRLAGVSLSLAAAGSRNGHTGSGDEELRTAVRQAAAETRETIRELRTLLVDIYPPTLQRSGLTAALSDLVAPLRAAGIAVTVDVPEDAGLSHESEALFYRVAQEAIRNARVHGHATQVEIALAQSPRGVRFSVRDDGRGFAAEELDPDRQERHFGLRLMRDLVAHAGGDLEIASQPANGTLIVVTMDGR